MIHTSAKPFKCKTCGQDFNQFSNLKRHERIHSDIKKYKCSYCPAAFKYINSWRYHEGIHTGDMLTCNDCAMQFRSHHGLKKHKCDPSMYDENLRKAQLKPKPNPVKIVRKADEDDRSGVIAKGIVTKAKAVARKRTAPRILNKARTPSKRTNLLKVKVGLHMDKVITKTPTKRKKKRAVALKKTAPKKGVFTQMKKKMQGENVLKNGGLQNAEALGTAEIVIKTESGDISDHSDADTITMGVEQNMDDSLLGQATGKTSGESDESFQNVRVKLEFSDDTGDMTVVMETADVVANGNEIPDSSEHLVSSEKHYNGVTNGVNEGNPECVQNKTVVQDDGHGLTSTKEKTTDSKDVSDSISMPVIADVRSMSN